MMMGEYPPLPPELIVQLREMYSHRTPLPALEFWANTFEGWKPCHPLGL